MSRMMRALVAFFLCLAPAAAQTCVNVDSILEKIATTGRDYRVVEPGPALARLREIFAETPPEGDPPDAARAIVIDLPSGVIVLYVVSDMACSPLMIGESPSAKEVRRLVFGERI